MSKILFTLFYEAVKEKEEKRGREPSLKRGGVLAVLPGSRAAALTGILADGTWVPMATVHFAAVTAALLAGWMAARASAFK